MGTHVLSSKDRSRGWDLDTARAVLVECRCKGQTSQLGIKCVWNDFWDGASF